MNACKNLCSLLVAFIIGHIPPAAAVDIEINESDVRELVTDAPAMISEEDDESIFFNCIEGPTSACTGTSVTFSIGSLSTCQKNNSNQVYEWTGGTGTSQGSTFTTTFNTPGTHSVTLTLVCPNGLDCGSTPERQLDTKSVTVVGSTVSDVNIVARTPQKNPSTTVCDNSYFILEVPYNASYSYSWTSVPAGIISILNSSNNSINVLPSQIPDVSHSIVVKLAVSAGGCTKYDEVTLVEEVTWTQPVITSQEYRKTIVTGQGGFLFQHHWQPNSGSQTTDPVSVTPSKVYNNSGQAFINRFVSPGNCWTTPNSIAVPVDVIPPKPDFQVTQPMFGTKNVKIIHPDKAHLLQYADYYFVNSQTCNATNILYSDNNGNGHTVQRNGTYYLRGKDKATNSWGPISDPISVTGIGFCEITGPTTVCVGTNNLNFSINCSQSFTNKLWYLDGAPIIQTIDGQPIHINGPAVILDGLSAGCHTLSVVAESENSSGSAYFDVTVVPEPHPGLDVFDIFIAKTSDLSTNIFTGCGQFDVALKVLNPISEVSYHWTTDDGQSVLAPNPSQFVYLVAGANGVDQTTFILHATKNGCESTAQKQIVIIKAWQSITSVETKYRYSLIYRDGPGSALNHYWHTPSSGLSFDEPLSNDIDYGNGYAHRVEESDTYFIRQYSPSNNCWSGASTSWNVVIDYAPPAAWIDVTKFYGYSELDLNFSSPEFASNQEYEDYILQFADYYLVNGSQGETNDPSKKLFDGFKIFQPGIYYVRGKDREHGVWGPTTTVEINLTSDFAFNWLHVLGYSGTEDNNTVSSETKSYYDQNGRLLQAQSKSISKGEVLLSQDLYDKLDRKTGSTLPAPLGASTFNYNSAFLLDRQGNFFSYDDFGSDDPFDDTYYGTLGWYYSDNNNLEPLTPKTKLPYSRTTYYNDGLDEAKMASGPGEALKLGAGHEVLTGTFPVHNELDQYLQLRSTVLAGATSPNTTLFHEGVQTVTRDQNGRHVISIADKSGTTIMTARNGTAEDFALLVSTTVIASASNKMVYLYLLEPQTVGLAGSGSLVIDNLLTDTEFIPSGVWPAGFYRIRCLSGTRTITYTNHYLDVAYSYYDNANRLAASISPNGIVQINQAVSYAQTDHTSYEYNHQGWLLSMTETDAGTTSYAYRKDGSIRFSQNAEQFTTGKYSYTNYDASGRPVESGEYLPATGRLFADVKNNVGILEAVGDSWMMGTPSISRRDWVKTHYDLPFADVELLLPGRRQDFLIGAVSWTENANIRTWYSYDELGRVQWMAQQPRQLSHLIFVADYKYDFLGNVLSVSNLTLESGTTTIVNQFHHYYSYDADKRLAQVATSVDGNNQSVQAKYYYYLHGPLKRIEIAQNLQGIDFVYNINGWLTSINDPSDDPGGDGNAGAHSSFRKDVFGMVLDYYESAMQVFNFTSTNELNDPNKFHHLPGLEDNSLIIVQESSSIADNVNIGMLRKWLNENVGGGE